MEKEVIVINEPNEIAKDFEEGTLLNVEGKVLKVENIILVRELGLHHLSIDNRDIWLADDEIKALECILKDYNADTNNFKRS